MMRREWPIADPILLPPQLAVAQRAVRTTETVRTKTNFAGVFFTMDWGGVLIAANYLRRYKRTKDLPQLLASYEAATETINHFVVHPYRGVAMLCRSHNRPCRRPVGIQPGGAATRRLCPSHTYSEPPRTDANKRQATRPGACG